MDIQSCRNIPSLCPKLSMILPIRYHLLSFRVLFSIKYFLLFSVFHLHFVLFVFCLSVCFFLLLLFRLSVWQSSFSFFYPSSQCPYPSPCYWFLKPWSMSWAELVPCYQRDVKIWIRIHNIFQYITLWQRWKYILRSD